ncbi:MAG: hypothetical protein BWY87_01032 [Deltaproteobacteria bacterium ADurb.Bin510]|nr:MAG: hypothetical protein BWY87_01032 [Deltaproteobacteria bacterium ADurb.Bin510]
MKLKTIPLLMTILLVAGSLNAQTISRNETVYVNLNASGQPQTTEVVTWLKNDGKSPAADNARLSGVKNIKGLSQPTVNQNQISFNTKETNIFYKGTPSRQLPIGVKISYYLNGKPIAFEKLNGKQGKLRVRIELTNRTAVTRNVTYTEIGTGLRRTRPTTVYTPFIVQVTTGMKIENFPSVDPGEGVFAVVGDTFKLSWITLPLPTSTIEFTAEASKIEMPSLLITAVPKSLPLAQYRSKINQLPNSLNKIYSGVGEVGGYLDQLKAGADQINAGAVQINDGHRKLAEAAPKMADGTAKLIQATDAQLALLKNVREINNGIKAKIEPLAKFTKKIGELNNALDASTEVATRTMEGGSFSQSFLKFLDAQKKPRPSVSEFPASIAVVQDGVRKLNDGANQLNVNAGKLYDGSTKLVNGSAKLSSNLVKLKANGTDKVRREMVSESAETMLMLAKLSAFDREARAYDRFAGRPSGVKSSVEFIMKTPGTFAQ